jgi:ribosomal protein S18 acetylase RimI-like enzyme
VAPTDWPASGAPARARDWYRGIHAEFCDVQEPWAHGTVVRASRYPDYYDLNTIRVERDPGMSADELAAFADEVQGDLAHRRLDFERAEAAEPLRRRFEELGWMTERLVWMRHDTAPPPQSDIEVAEVPYEEVHELRVAWLREDFPDIDMRDYLDEEREVAERRGAQVLAVSDGGAPVGFAQLEHRDGSAEIASAYFHPDQRGRGLGTALTCAAIHAAGGARDLWIVADDEGRPKELYGRLGFVSAWTATEITRLP